MVSMVTVGLYLVTRLHQALASTLRQLCNNTSNTVLVENNGVPWKWVAIPIWSDFIVFNENSIAMKIVALHNFFVAMKQPGARVCF